MQQIHHVRQTIAQVGVQAINAAGNMSYKSTQLSRAEFLRSEKATELQNELSAMTSSPLYNTHVVSLLHADSQLFIDKHMRYMSNHLKMDHSQYVQNLKLMTKISR